MSIHATSTVLTDALHERHVYFEVIPHPRTQSAAAEATATGVDPDHVAKTIVLLTDAGFVRAVLSASKRIDLRKVKAALGAGEVHLASEQVLSSAYPEFELGAVPPIGGHRHDRVLMDEHLRHVESVVLEAGTHEQSVRIMTADLAVVTDALVSDICED
jgi:Ala-tRNA(Pro) deacylase